MLRNTGILGGRRRFRRNAKDERAMLRGVRFVEGRSDWDRACAENINPNLEYFTCPRMLREAFFAHAPWSEEAMERHTILVHQSHMPLKGLHFMLDALSILTRKYPDVRLYVAGAKMIHRRSLRGMVFTSGYSNYLRKKIEALGLSDRVTFTGRLDEQKMAERIATVNVVAIPSTIENAPNSLAEAMLLGTPCVASFVGGNADILTGNMIDTTAVGLLTIATGFSEMISFIPQAIIDSLRPLVMESKLQSEARYVYHLKILMAIILWGGVMLAVVVTLFAPFVVVLLYGSAFSDSADVLRVYIWSFGLASIGSVKNIWLICERKARYEQVFTLGGALVSVALNLLLIPRFGIVGAAAATIAAQAASNVLIPACFQNTRAVSRYMMEALMLRGVPVKGALRAVIGRKTEL